MDKDLKPLDDDATAKQFKEHVESWNDSPRCVRCHKEATHEIKPSSMDCAYQPHCGDCVNDELQICQEVADHEMRNFGGAYGVPSLDVRQINRATDCPAVDVGKKKRPAVEGFKDEVIDGILSELREEFPSLDSEHASFRLACKRFYDYLASRNLIRTIHDDMVLLPRAPTKRMIQFGVDNREDGGGVTDIYIAMIHGHETEKAYEEGK